MKTKRFIKILSLTLILIAVWQSAVFAAGGIRYTVKSGDSMWKIAVQYEIGLRKLSRQIRRLQIRI